MRDTIENISLLQKQLNDLQLENQVLKNLLDQSGIQAYDVWKEKKNYGKVSMGVVRTTYLIDENGIIVKAFDKVKAADNPAQMLGELG